MSTPGVTEVAEAIRAKGFTSLHRERIIGVYQFFSFDLVNSTLFKSQHPQVWPIVVTRFYEILQSILSTSNLSARLWKYVGDEVLFYVHVTEANKLIDALHIGLNTIRATEEALHRHHPETRVLLSIKGTTWIALAEYIPPGAANAVYTEHKNIIITTGRRPDRYERDFLGPDIDIGFRISRFSLRRRLVVSAHLAAIIFGESSKAMQLDQLFRIVSYEKLKGVWADRHYPIIWFEEDWSEIEGSFLYDELLISEIAKKAVEVSKSVEVGLSAVRKVFKDLCKEAEISTILTGLRSSAAQDSLDRELEVPVFKYAEIHCAAVCFGRDGKVLAAKRLSSKRRFPGAYEFGCGQLKLGESFSDCLKRAYREDFGVDITVGENPSPVATYLIYDADEERNIPGIIFWAEIDASPETVSGSYVREKHDSIQWFDPESLPIGSSEFVPNFVETVHKASEARKREENQE